MKNNYKGFTLVELLVAATIIGFLAIVATTSFRNSAAETRWTQAKALTNQLASAAEALTTERNGVYFSSNTMFNPLSLQTYQFMKANWADLSKFSTHASVQMPFAGGANVSTEYTATLKPGVSFNKDLYQYARMVDVIDWSQPQATILRLHGTGCNLNNMGANPVSPSQLVSCHFVEQGDWSNEYFQYKVYPTAKNGVPGACVTVNDEAKLPAKYKGLSYCSCAGEKGKEGKGISC